MAGENELVSGVSPTQRIVDSVTQNAGDHSPDTGADPNDSGAGGKLPGSARYRRQRDEARAVIMKQQQDIQDLTSRLLALENAQAGGREDNGPATSWEEMSLQDLHRMATNRDILDSNPESANHALAVYAKKVVEGERDRLRSELRQEILGEVRAEAQQTQQLHDIEREFGPQSQDRDSDLYQEADAIYRRDYEPTIPPDPRTGKRPLHLGLVKASFREAQRRLDAQNVQQQPQPQVQTGIRRQQYPDGSPAMETPRLSSNPSTRQYTAPPPAARVETRSDGARDGLADMLAQRKQLIAAGDTRGAFRNVVTSLWNQ